MNKKSKKVRKKTAVMTATETAIADALTKRALTVKQISDRFKRSYSIVYRALKLIRERGDNLVRTGQWGTGDYRYRIKAKK